ncbi:MAG TPA: alpha/beta hydrolase [Terriglobales bacterium]|nr:alpha/beta hydrolase [Terriglobales bacterium]
MPVVDTCGLPAGAGQAGSIGSVALQIHCTGRGAPTVVVETGLEEFAFDWTLVQQRVEKFTRICTYDRGGYGGSELDAAPRTFAQINLELHELLRAAGEKPPYVLVGHSFGGPVIRNYAVRYPEEVAGMVLAESVAEHQPMILGGKPTLLKDFASGKAIPEPTLQTSKLHPEGARPGGPLARDYAVLPSPLQQLHQRFAGAAALEAAENSQREWSSEYLAQWDRQPQRGLLGTKPLLVITRAESGYDASPNYSLQQVDGQRLRAQTEQLQLSSNSAQWVVPFGHDLHLEAPGIVAAAIHVVVESARRHLPLANLN